MQNRVGRRLGGAAIVLALSIPTAALAHVERTSYWPDPAPDKSGTPAAGGAVPKARSLESALDRSPRGDTRVGCQSDSLDRAARALSTARLNGDRPRPPAAPT